MSQLFQCLLLLFISFTLFLTPSTSKGASVPLQALVAPITKDSLTSLYAISLNNHSPFLLDLSSPFFWSPCSVSNIRPSILCNSPTCSLAASFHPLRCPPPARVRRAPCRCAVSAADPVAKTCASAELTLANVSIATTDGRNPFSPITVVNLITACASRGLLSGLPRGWAGVAGLSSSALALSWQALSRLSLRQQFAICLPSSISGPSAGVAFLGDGPYRLLPPTAPELTGVLSYTPLLTNPLRPDKYYVDLRSIAVAGRTVPFLARMLEFDSLGHGGAAVSTSEPYTVLRSHVYRPFVQAFAEATRGIQRAAAVGPFGLCLNTSGLGSTRAGLPVARIDLVLGGGKNWTVYGENSMKRVGPETACLAFVDGGERAEHAVAIGGFQMEDNLVVFDLATRRLGYSSSLLSLRTTCGSFNFTTER